MTNFVQSLWAEPRAPGAPARVWRDWVLVAVLATTATLEATLRDDVVWRPFALCLCLGLIATLLWRRTHPFAMVAVAFGVVVAVDLVRLVAGVEGVGLDTTVFVVLLPYSLFRWGSGREAILGLPIILAAYTVGVSGEFTGVGDAVGAAVVLFFPAVLGATVRYWTSTRQRELEQAKLREREQLARELHDTVAHHVSAIAIRAQAGRVVSASHPGAALEALEVIEEEASRTLAEMRLMVGGLRADEPPSLSPQLGLADLEQLALRVGPQPTVTVARSGDLDALAPSVQAAIYRIAQESVTNAVRHARNATRIDIAVVGEDGCVRLTVRDDGDPAGSRNPNGYGLVGMNERATLLGGSFAAGPGSEGGWTVRAELPRAGPAR